MKDKIRVVKFTVDLCGHAYHNNVFMIGYNTILGNPHIDKHGWREYKSLTEENKEKAYEYMSLFVKSLRDGTLDTHFHWMLNGIANWVERGLEVILLTGQEPELSHASIIIEEVEKVIASRRARNIPINNLTLKMYDFDHEEPYQELKSELLVAA